MSKKFDDARKLEDTDENYEEYEDHTAPHWAHLAFALGAARGF